MTRLERLTAIALFLSARLRDLAREIAEKFAVRPRTVYRDMRALSAAGFPVEGNAGDGYRVPQTSYLRPLALTGQESEALTLAAHAFGAVAGPELADALTRATLKLEAVLDAPTRARVIDLQKRIVTSHVVRASGLSPEVLASLSERRVARIQYHDPRTDTSTQRKIEALGLVYAGQAWWLVAYCRLRKDARAFRVDRITRWQLEQATFQPRNGLSLADVIARDQHLAESLFGS
jgi:predicted DNA-binding transcriptional regulator YafY